MMCIWNRTSNAVTYLHRTGSCCEDSWTWALDAPSHCHPAVN